MLTANQFINFITTIILNGIMNSKKEYQQIAADEEAGHEQPRISRPTIWHYICIFVLALGWAATAVHNYRTQPVEHEESESTMLHVYHNTPIPREVFNPVKKVFDKDPRYMGDGPEVNHYWDKLVAGKYPLIGIEYLF